MTMMMYEGKHIHYSPDQRKLCSYSSKLCRQRRINGFAFCIRHILEDKTAPFKQCAHVAKYNNQKCSNPIPANENREFCNSHMQVAGMAPKKERKNKKEKEKEFAAILDGKMKFSERVKVLLKGDLEDANSPGRHDIDCGGIDDDDDVGDDEDPYEFPGSASDLIKSVNCNSVFPSHVVRVPPRMTTRMPNNVTKVATPEFATVSVGGGVGSCYNDRVVVKQESNCKGSGCNSDRSSKCFTNNIHMNNSNNNTVKKSSKSVNRLEAKINRDRILDKLKKNHVLSGPQLLISKDSSMPDTTVMDACNDVCYRQHLDSTFSPGFSSSMCKKSMVTNLSTNVDPIFRSSTESCKLTSKTSTRVETSAVALGAHESTVMDDYPCTRTSNNLIEILPKRRGWRWPWKRPELVPRSLQTYKRLLLEKRDLRTSQFPLGLEISDSESSDSDSELYQEEWFCPPAEVSSWLAEGGTGSFRSARSSVERAELRRRCRQLCHSQTVLAPERRSFSILARTLSRAARNQPAGATKLVEVLSTPDGNQHRSKTVDKNKWTKNLALTKQKCCYSNEDSECSNTALPYTRHCIKHIMYNVDQLLFEHCTAKFADNTQCCIPVFDICHELPLCLEHARKRDNYGKLSTEPKPKKPRKKTKPSALTRPSRRGKNKKRQSSCCRPESDLTTSLMGRHSSISDMAPSSSSLHYGMSSDLSPSTSDLGGHVQNDLDGPMETDLSTDLGGQLSPDAMDKSLDLPMDAVELANQASRLLEDHDFTEVLNKIPDEAFRELFNDGKNGDMLPSREEAEELERALAAVDKDVKSLVKMSTGGHGLHIDLHDAILHGGDHNLNTTLDTTLSELSGIDAITGSLTSSDLNNLSQVLSTMAGDCVPLTHIPMLSDMGFAHGCQRLGDGDGDDVLVDDLDDDSHHWTTATTTTANEHQVCGHNGFVNAHAQHNYGHSPRFASQAPSALVNASKHETKSVGGGGRHCHLYNSIENSLGLTSMQMSELTENSTESVS